MKQHQYELSILWTGNEGEGTSSYTSYSRDHQISGIQKMTVIEGSSDKAFRGDETRYNPEELLLASLSSCHMLWTLHLCAEAGIQVLAYSDKPTGIMIETEDGGGKFTLVQLHPSLLITDENQRSLLPSIHHKAHQRCFIANSVNFPVEVIAL
ncbi:MAG: OsmC family protein [Cytophagaceae bacterium]|jgi:organic hydroperoxide reductase OsmC/OhrA|nr:OsmC family protein [Cytophagaceae bacterium]